MAILLPKGYIVSKRFHAPLLWRARQSVYLCVAHSAPWREVNGGLIFSQKNRLSVEVVRTLLAKKSVQQKCLSCRLFSSRRYKYIQRQALEEKTLPCFWSAKMAFPDGTGTGKQSRWTPILMQCTNWKKMVLERLSTFRKSASNVSHSAIAGQERSACMLNTVQHALAAYSLVRPLVQCSMLCMLFCDPASFAY